MAFKDSWVLHCTQDENKNAALIEKTLFPIDRPDGIISSVEKLAITTYQVLKKTRLKVPQDVRIVSFSNMSIADLLDPPLSTIAQPADKIGIACGKLLMKKLKIKKQEDIQDEVIIIPSVLHIRKSSLH